MGAWRDQFGFGVLHLWFLDTQCGYRAPESDVKTIKAHRRR